MNTMTTAEQIVALSRLAVARPEIAFVVRFCGLETAAKLYL